MSEYDESIDFSRSDTQEDEASLSIVRHGRFDAAKLGLKKTMNSLFLLLYMLTKQNKILGKTMVFLMALDFLQLISFGLSFQFSFTSPLLTALQFSLQFVRIPIHLFPTAVNYSLVFVSLIAVYAVIILMLLAMYRLSANEQQFPDRLLFILRLSATVFITGLFVPVLSILIRVPFQSVIETFNLYADSPSEAQTYLFLTVVVVLASVATVIPFSLLCFSASVAFYSYDFQAKFDFLARPHIRMDFILLGLKSLLTLSFAVASDFKFVLCGVCLAVFGTCWLTVLILAPYYRPEMNFLRIAMMSTIVGVSVANSALFCLHYWADDYLSAYVFHLLEPLGFTLIVVIHVIFGLVCMKIRYMIVRPPKGSIEKQIKRIEKSHSAFWATTLCYGALDPHFEYKSSIKRALTGTSGKKGRSPSVLRTSRERRPSQSRRDSVRSRSHSRSNSLPGEASSSHEWADDRIEMINPTPYGMGRHDADTSMYSTDTTDDPVLFTPMPQPRTNAVSVGFAEHASHTIGSPKTMPSPLDKVTGPRLSPSPGRRKSVAPVETTVKKLIAQNENTIRRSQPRGDDRASHDKQTKRWSLTYKYNIQGASQCFEAARARHERSSWVLTQYCNFVFLIGNQHMAYFVLNKLSNRRPIMDLAYTIYRLHHEHEQLQGTGLGAMGQGGDQASAIRYIQFQKTMRLAQRFQHEAGELLLSFWQSLLHDYDVYQTHTISQKLHETFTGAQTQYTSMMRRFTNVPDLLRGYAWFIETLLYDSATAKQLIDQAAGLEQKGKEGDGSSRGGDMLNTYDDEYSMYSETESQYSAMAPFPLGAIQEEGAIASAATESTDADTESDATQRTETVSVHDDDDELSGHDDIADEFVSETSLQMRRMLRNASFSPRKSPRRHHTPSPGRSHQLTSDSYDPSIRSRSDSHSLPPAAQSGFDMLERAQTDDRLGDDVSEFGAPAGFIIPMAHVTSTPQTAALPPKIPTSSESRREMSKIPSSSPRWLEDVTPREDDFVLGLNTGNTSTSMMGAPPGRVRGKHHSAGSLQSSSTRVGDPELQFESSSHSLINSTSNSSPRIGLNLPLKSMTGRAKALVITPRSARNKSSRDKEGEGKQHKGRREQESTTSLNTPKTPGTQRSARKSTRQLTKRTPNDGNNSTDSPVNTAPNSGRGMGSKKNSSDKRLTDRHVQIEDDTVEEEEFQDEYAPTELLIGLNGVASKGKIGDSKAKTSDLRSFFDGAAGSEHDDDIDDELDQAKRMGGLHTIRAFLFATLPLAAVFVVAVLAPFIVSILLISWTSNVGTAVAGYQLVSSVSSYTAGLTQRSLTVAATADMQAAKAAGFGGADLDLGLYASALASLSTADQSDYLRAYGLAVSHSMLKSAVCLRDSWAHISQTAMADVDDEALTGILSGLTGAELGLLGVSSSDLPTLSTPCQFSSCTAYSFPDVRSGVATSFTTALTAAATDASKLSNLESSLQVSGLYTVFGPDIKSILNSDEALTAKLWVESTSSFSPTGTSLVSLYSTVTTHQTNMAAVLGRLHYPTLSAATQTALATIAPADTSAIGLDDVAMHAMNRFLEANAVADPVSGIRSLVRERVQALYLSYLSFILLCVVAFVLSASAFFGMIVVLILFNGRIISRQRRLVRNLKSLPKTVLQAIIIATARHLGLDEKLTEGAGGDGQSEDESTHPPGQVVSHPNRWTVSTAKSLADRKPPILSKRPVVVSDPGQKRVYTYLRYTAFTLAVFALAFIPLFMSMVVMLAPLQSLLVASSMVYSVTASIHRTVALAEQMSSAMVAETLRSSWTEAALTAGGYTSLAALAAKWNSGQLDLDSIKSTLRSESRDLALVWENLVHGGIYDFDVTSWGDLDGYWLPVRLWPGMLMFSSSQLLVDSNKCLLGESSCSLGLSLDDTVSAFVERGTLLSFASSLSQMGDESVDRLRTLALVLSPRVLELHEAVDSMFSNWFVASIGTVICSFVLTLVTIGLTIVISVQLLRRSQARESLKVQILIRSIPRQFLRWSLELRQVVDITQ
ncbi:HAT repeat-containing protein [Carpediemonas membranifera]|uniref:HAT repeat-containing protein n=1 Tax=Carpediemonas membranifera TaxID=201153 RepID=A0A8J6B1C9_9EUKA|nr:HAT repeat-containing protein [Carpediemonas membranifera]|eukprot:KAG9392194.1 HAT repeat-containing protein [Carpediemonas membranifera]